MRIEIKSVDLTALSSDDRDSINEVLTKSSNATVFHSIEWNEVLIDEFGLQIILLLATKGEQPAGLYSFSVDGAVCRSPATSLESVYGGPISMGDNRIIAELLRDAERFQKIAWFDIWTPAMYDISPLIEMSYSYSEMYTSILNLQKPEEELWAGLNQKKRNKIRKAQKNDVIIVEGDTSLVDEYYEMIVSAFTRARINILPKTFYKRVIESLGPKGIARLVLAKHDGRFIAGAIFLLHKNTAYYWHGASHREYLSLAPNDLIQWEHIKWARERGYKNYDLVRVEPGRLPGIANFKMSFGGETVPCYHLQKATLGYQLWRVLRFATSPRRIIRKMRSLTAGKDNEN
jgi:hypothetical protein